VIVSRDLGGLLEVSLNSSEVLEFFQEEKKLSNYQGFLFGNSEEVD
jgi:hypothetical protein